MIQLPNFRIILYTAVCAALVFCSGNAYASYTFNWTGASNNTWTTTGNWSVTGSGSGTATYPGSGGRTDDIVNFGVTGSTFSNQPLLSTNVTIASLNFGKLQYKGTVGSILSGTTFTGTALTVNSTLTITGNITTVDFNGSTSGTLSNDIRGTGSVTCANLIFGSTTSSATSNNAILFLEVTSLHVTNNVTLNINVTSGNGAGIRLEGGTTTVDGQITFNNLLSNSITTTNNAYFTINAQTTYKTPTNTNTNPSLVLTNVSAVGTIPSPHASVNFNGTSGYGGKNTVTYTATSPNVYVANASAGFGSGGGTINTATATYDNLVINGGGTAVIGANAASLTGTNTLKLDSTFTTNSNATFATVTVALTVGTDWTNTATITGGAGTTDINGSLINSGTMNMGTGAVTIAQNYTNTGAFNPNASALISFDGTTQTLTDATTTGTNFYNVAFTGGGTKTMVAGSHFTVAPTDSLVVKSSSTLAVGNATSTTSALTILSTSGGDASIGNLSAGTITGSINVNRYVQGPLRRYMLLSSPVTNGTTTYTNTTVASYNLVPLIATTYITGPSGSVNGFDDAPSTSNSPSVFVYDENSPVTANVNLVVNNEYKPFSSIYQGLPAANGFLYYYRGSRSISNPFSKPFPATDNAVLNFFGGVIKGAGTNGAMTANIVNFPSTPPTYYTAASVSAPATLSYHGSITKTGLNLIGNPYASAINLRAVYLANLSATGIKFFYMLVKEASTGTNSYSTKFAVYDASAGSVGAGASQFALSGQGFFVQGTKAGAMVFNETMKVPYASYTSAPSSNPIFNITALKGKNLAIATRADQAVVSTSSVPRITLELVQDSIIHNSTDVDFDNSASDKFIAGEDAPYFQPSGQANLLYSLSSDSIGCFVNYTGNLEKIKRVNLVVTFGSYGLYKITSPVKFNIDPRYVIYLVDKYKNDSLDVVHNTDYTFNVETNAASYAHDRFYLSIGIAPGHDYHLLDFAGQQVINKINLKWTTDNESTFTRFYVQKSLDAGKTFATIDSLQSTGAGSYTYTDVNPGSGTILYRLNQALVSGDSQLSKTLQFTLSPNLTEDKFMVFPSTVTTSIVNIKLRNGSVSQNKVRINIVSPSGAVLKSLSSASTQIIQQNVSELITGLYFVVAIDEVTGEKIGSGTFFKQ